MHKWREERWDAFCLVTPNWQCQLPGHPYDGPDPHGFMVKEEILDYLDGFARKTSAACGRASRSGRSSGGGPVSRHDHRGALHGRRGVSGDQPLRRRLAAAMRRAHPGLDRSDPLRRISQRRGVAAGRGRRRRVGPVGRADRRGPASRRPQGASCHRQRAAVRALLSRPRCGRLAVGHRAVRRSRSRTRAWATSGTTPTTTSPAATADATSICGLSRRDGMSLYGRLKDVEQGRMLFEPNLEGQSRRSRSRLQRHQRADRSLHRRQGHLGAAGRGSTLPVWAPHDEPSRARPRRQKASAPIVWATGFTPDWSYVRLPIFDGSGYPINRRGVTSVPGVYVLGLPWLWTWGSGRFLSVGRDAEHVVKEEACRSGVRQAAQ